MFQWNTRDQRWQRKGSDKHEGEALESQMPGESGDLYVGWSISLDYTGDTVAFGLPGIWAWHKEIPLSVNVAQDPEELTEAQVLRIKQETEFMGAVRVFHWTYAPSGSVVGEPNNHPNQPNPRPSPSPSPHHPIPYPDPTSTLTLTRRSLVGEGNAARGAVDRRLDGRPQRRHLQARGQERAAEPRRQRARVRREYRGGDGRD